MIPIATLLENTPKTILVGYLNERSLDRNKGRIVIDPIRASTIKQPYVREDELLAQLLVLIDQIDLDKTGMKKNWKLR